MKDYGIFDILGPIMIGPSSSHTAGAARLGYMAKTIVDRPFKEVNFYLHGSFAKTKSGHGTDRALLAGVLGMKPDDERLRDSFEVARSRNIGFNFYGEDLGNVHPNTVKTKFTLEDGSKYYVVGSSVGGGNIEIINIDGTEVNFTGSNPTLLVQNYDRQGVIAHISSTFAKSNINIATMTVIREKDLANMVLTADSYITKDMVNEIKACPHILYAKRINPNKE